MDGKGIAILINLTLLLCCGSQISCAVLVQPWTCQTLPSSQDALRSLQGSLNPKMRGVSASPGHISGDLG